MSSKNVPPLLEVTGLKKYFLARDGLFHKNARFIKAVDGIGFTIPKGETLGLVGESGCGKSTTGRTIVRLYEPTDGMIRYAGTDLAKLDGAGLKPFRRKIQMIFQDPYSSLSVRMTVRDIVAEPLIVHGETNVKRRNDRVRELLDKVGLNADHADRYPHELSGGQRQRVGIARALVVGPEFLVCDEPISALDVSIQAQVVNMLEDLQAEMGLTYLFIAHDLSMVRYLSDRIGVMYLGKLVELAASEELYRHPGHPYTKVLLASFPVPNPRRRRVKEGLTLEGEIPSPLHPPEGCRLSTRCPEVRPICRQCEPELREVDAGHWVACHLN